MATHLSKKRLETTFKLRLKQTWKEEARDTDVKTTDHLMRYRLWRILFFFFNPH